MSTLALKPIILVIIMSAKYRYRTKYSLAWQSVDFNICGNEMLTPAGLEVQIFVDTKDAKNVPAVLKEKIRE